MLTEDQKVILAELKKRPLSPEQQTIVTELERRDSTPTLDTNESLSDEGFSKLTREQKMESIKGEKGLTDVSLTPLTKPGLEAQATEMAESEFGQKHPYLSASLGTALSEGPEAAASVLPISKAPAIGKAVRPLYTGVKTLGKELGETMAESGLKRAPEMLGEPRTRSAILEFVDALRGLKDKPVKAIKETFEPQGIVQKYDELGRVLDYLNVARQRAPKQVVSPSTVQELSALKSKFGEALKETAPKVGEKMGEMSVALKRNQLVKSLANTANPLWWAKKAMRGF